jgi:hypothetical protein
MTERRSFDTRLAEAMKVYAAAADRAFDPSKLSRSVLDSSQRRGFLSRLVAAVPTGQAWRSPIASTTLKFALAGAAVLLVAVFGIGLYFSQPSGLGGPPGDSPSPTATAAPV